MPLPPPWVKTVFPSKEQRVTNGYLATIPGRAGILERLTELALFCDTDETGAESVAYFANVRAEKAR